MSDQQAEADLHNALLEINSDWSDWDELAALKRVLQIAEDALRGRPDYPLAAARLPERPDEGEARCWCGVTGRNHKLYRDRIAHEFRAATGEELAHMDETYCPGCGLPDLPAAARPAVPEETRKPA